jgi:hypothetical protein
VTRRWALLAAYTVLIYTTLPFGGGAGRAVLRSPVGAWLFGPGLVLLAAILVAALVVRLRRNAAGVRAYALLALTGAGWAGALVWLRTMRLERIHVPEYGLAAWLAWRAVRPHVPGPTAAYIAAAAIAALIGWGEEEIQRFVPGRVYDPRDIVANALGAILGVLLVATLREAAARRSPAPREAVGFAAPTTDGGAARVGAVTDRSEHPDAGSV